MGNSCGIPEETDNNSHQPIPYNSNQPQQRNEIKANKKHNTSEKDFKDFEEYKNGKTIGSGIQQIPSYKCTIPYDQLSKLREEFWLSKSKSSNKRCWIAIKECCSTDSDSAAMLLEIAEMACLQGDLRQVFSLSYPDYIFKVPNFCVCDPCFERDYEKLKKKAEKIEEVNMSIILFDLNKNQNTKLDVTNKTLIQDIKKQFAEKMKINMEKNAIRLLFKGQELINEHMLYYHNVENDSKIQVMIRSLNM